jgi:hypothetical protein
VVFSSHLWTTESTVCVTLQRTPPQKELAKLNKCLNRDVVESSAPIFFYCDEAKEF